MQVCLLVDGQWVEAEYCYVVPDKADIHYFDGRVLEREAVAEYARELHSTVMYCGPFEKSMTRKDLSAHLRNRGFKPGTYRIRQAA